MRTSRSTSPGHPRRTRARVAAVSALLLVGGPALWPAAEAVFVATTISTGNSVTAAATFPNYQTSASNSAPTFYHRSEETQTSGTSPALVDAMNSNAKPGNLNGASDGPRVWWRFNGDTSPTAQDYSGSVNSGTLTSNSNVALRAATGFGSPAFTGQALTLDGAVDYLKGPVGVVDTAAAYSASVWVYLTDKTADRWALAMTGAAESVFALGYENACDCWTLRTTSSDAAATTAKRQGGALGVGALNTWTHLSVTRTSGGTVTFYVNATAVGTVTAGFGTWTATGSLIAGNLRATTLPATNYWAGSLDEVRVYPRVLTGTELTAIAAHKPTAEWGFNEEQGTTSTDLSGNGNTATLSSTSAWSKPGRSSGALSGDGANHSATAASAVDTTKSFTVSALVRLNATATAGVHCVVSQSSVVTAYSGFILKYNTIGAYRSFTFLVPISGAVIRQVNSTAASATATWHWITGVYDQSSGSDQLRLYINGARADNAAGVTTTPIASTKALEVGRAQFGSFVTMVDYFDGQIDVVRTYQSALSAAQIAALGAEPANSSATAPGALQGGQQGLTATTAIAYSGIAGGYNPYNFASVPNTFSLECWFRTNTTTGGQIIGFADTLPTVGVSTKADRMVYLETGGKLVFAVLPAAEARTTATYNDGAWHHLTATMGAGTTTGLGGVVEAAGMRLYVDGVLVASNATTTGTAYSGYLRWGFARVSGWTTTPTTPMFRGAIDDVAVYPTQLTHQDILWHYYANH